VARFGRFGVGAAVSFVAAPGVAVLVGNVDLEQATRTRGGKHPGSAIESAHDVAFWSH
jgi:hypothetical protein